MPLACRSPIEAKTLTPVVILSFEQGTAGFGSVPSQFRGRKPWRWPSTNHTRGLADRRLFRILPCCKGTTSMSPSRLEPGTAVSVTNHYTGWMTPYLKQYNNNVL
ncbi:hypothetical protein TNCV_4170391 [Trichonephila clavipes]|nr:hypothetical protein TNCV_4170391 [Trichonephila clavipes]